MSDSTDNTLSNKGSVIGIDPGGNGFKGSVPEEEKSQLSTVEIAELIWKERKFVFRRTCLCLVVFAIAAFLWPKRYTATTTLMPPDFGSGAEMAVALSAVSDSGSGGGGGRGTLIDMASQLLGLNSSGDLFVGVLGSQTVEDRMVDRFKLMDVYSARYRKDAREKLEDNTDIKSDRKTGLISISVEDRRPERAAEMAKAYVDELNRALAEVNTSAAHRERVFIESRLKEIKEELDASAKEFAVFASQNAAIDVPSQAQAMVQSAATLQGQLIAAQSELKGFEQIYTSNNIRVKTMKAHVAELEHQLAKFSGTEVDPAKDPSLAKGELYPSVRQLPLLGVKYLDLFRRTKIDEAVFELLTKGYEIAKVQEAREVPTVQVLDVATVPEKKTSPHRLLIMLGGALLGFALTAGYLISERLWKSTNDSDSAKALTRDILWSVKSQVERAPGYPKFRRGFQRIAPILGTRRNELNGH